MCKTIYFSPNLATNNAHRPVGAAHKHGSLAEGQPRLFQDLLDRPHAHFVHADGLLHGELLPEGLPDELLLERARGQLHYEGDTARNQQSGPKEE